MKKTDTETPLEKDVFNLIGLATYFTEKSERKLQLQQKDLKLKTEELNMQAPQLSKQHHVHQVHIILTLKSFFKSKKANTTVYFNRCFQTY